jgi:hypothetical protein
VSARLSEEKNNDGFRPTALQMRNVLAQASSKASRIRKPPNIFSV